jgi:hypothetical protein
LHDERGLNGARLKQVWMVAHFPELHQNIHDAEEVTIIERLLGFITVDVFIVEETLAPGEVALDDVLYLFWQLLLNIFFQTSE